MKNYFNPRIFIDTPLAPACGEWVSLPIDEEELEAIRQRIASNGDYIIADSEDLPGIGEYESLTDVNEYAEWLVDEEPEADNIEAFLDAGISFQDIPQKYERGDYCVVEGTDETDLAANYIEELGGLEYALTPENIAMYFDYEKFGRDLKIDGFSQHGSHWVHIE
jgi:antirestriction protein